MNDCVSHQIKGTFIQKQNTCVYFFKKYVFKSIMTETQKCFLILTFSSSYQQKQFFPTFFRLINQIIYQQMIYTYFYTYNQYFSNHMDRMNQGKFWSLCCPPVTIISILAIIFSIVFQILWLFIISIILSLIILCQQKRNIQILFAKIVIYFRCSTSWSTKQLSFGDILDQTKFGQHFIFPSQEDTVYVLMMLEQKKIAKSYVKSISNSKKYWLPQKYLDYQQQKILKPQSSLSDNLVQRRKLFQKCCKNCWFNYLKSQKVSMRQVSKEFIQNQISLALSLNKNFSTINNLLGQYTQIPQSSFNQLNLLSQKTKQTITNPTNEHSLRPLSTTNSKAQSITNSNSTSDSKFYQQIDQQSSNRGLTNLGNTCYMNSAIQCLHKTYELTETIKKKQNISSNFITAYLDTMDSLSSTKQSFPFRPSTIKQLISKYYSIFQGYKQQDSSQLLSTVLNYINDQLKENSVKKFYNIDKSIKRSDQQLFIQYIRKDESRSKSIIDDLFIGRFLTVYKCLECDQQQKLFQKFNILYLPLPNENQLSLKKCMKQFCKIDQLRGINAWDCLKCEKETKTDKTMSVYQSNTILIICFKRFTEDNKKINTLITFQQQINLNQIASKSSKIANKTYDLYGVINHSGSSLLSGHYYSYCKSGNTWKEYNDSSVSKIDQSMIVTPNAFVLLYRLKK